LAGRALLFDLDFPHDRSGSGQVKLVILHREYVTTIVDEDSSRQRSVVYIFIKNTEKETL
jgi:hypothetical protein